MIQGEAIIFDGITSAQSRDARITRHNMNMRSAFKYIAELYAITPIFMLRLKPNMNRYCFRPVAVEILNTLDAGVAVWELVLNPTVTSAQFADMTDSIVQIATAGDSSLDDGVIMSSGYIHGACRMDCSDCHTKWLSSSLTGVSDVVILRVRLLAGTVNLSASISWTEKR
jgi:hypothetical protein